MFLPLVATVAVAVLLLVAGARAQRPPRVLAGGVLLTAVALVLVAFALPVALAVLAGWVVASFGFGLTAAAAAATHTAPARA